MPKNIQTAQIFIKAFQSIKGNIVFFLSLIIIVILLSLAIDYIAASLQVNSIMGMIIYEILQFFIVSEMAIMTHRYILLNETDVFSFFKWSSIELKFFLWVLGIYFFLAFALSIVLALLIPFAAHEELTIYTYSITYLFMIVTGIFIARFFLIFPGTAIGINISIAKSWEQSKGNVFRLFLLLIAIPLMTNYILSELQLSGVIGSIVLLFVGLAILIFEIAILSHCYEALSMNEEESIHLT